MTKKTLIDDLQKYEDLKVSIANLQEFERFEIKEKDII